ncbi:MAG: homoserine O-succinyltransferase [Methyloprofundus sp.]|nr:homoserine O-succinyltransferase [Methyloprofundus sp.]
MPLVAHTQLPTFVRLQEEGEDILNANRASHQHIRELHIGFLNMMPDAALEATERQFFRLVGACNQIAQFHIHPFTIDGLPRSEAAQAHISKYYETFEQLKKDGLDALIISGANVTHQHLQDEIFWQPLTEVFAWAQENVTSTLCSCLASHAFVQHFYGLERTRLPEKRWGVYDHKIIDRKHPLVAEINTRFDVPHSRFNNLAEKDLQALGIQILVTSQEAGVHLAVSPDGFRAVLFQGHPEYDAISLMKEYKREVMRFLNKEIDNYPPLPVYYFGEEAQAVFNTYKEEVLSAFAQKINPPKFPEENILELLDNTWRDTAKAVFNNWLGKVYQITNQDRRLPFMDGINPENPLGLG